MTFHQYINNALGSVQNNPLSSGGTNLVTNSALGTLLATLTFPFYLTLWAINTNVNTSTTMEIVEVTANPTSNNFTINRAVQGTTAHSHNQNDNCALLFTQGNMNEVCPTGANSQGSIYYIGSNGLPVLLSPGTSGNFLQSQGASANPAWAAGLVANYGGASDGTVTLDGSTTYNAFSALVGSTYTLSRDIYCGTLTINGGVTLNTNGYIVFANTTAGSGTVTTNVGAGRFRGIAGGAGGAAGVGGNSYLGQPGVTTTAQTSSPGSAGATGGNGGTTATPGGFGAGATGGTASTFVKPGVIAAFTMLGLDVGLNGTPVAWIGAGVAGGGGGGNGNNSSSGAGGAGGAGGTSGGGILFIVNNWGGSYTYVNTGSSGTAGSAAGGSNGAGGGGGAGGSGGWVMTIYGTKTWTGSYTLTGGSGGGGGAKNGTGTNGSAGPTGTTGTSYEVTMSSLT